MADRSTNEEINLAAACASANARAIADLEARYFSQLDGPLRRIGLDAAGIDEVKQELRVHLFVPPKDSASPGIAGFAGRGSLKGWLRVVAVRMGQRRRSRALGASAAGEETLEALADIDPELALMKSAYREEFRRAFNAATASLDARDRTILALYAIDGHEMGDIAKMHGVHRTTVMRWLERIQDSIRLRTEEELRGSLAIDASQYRSILRLIQSRFELSLEGVLRPPEPS